MTRLQGKTILVTRDISQAGSLKTRLQEHGAHVICIPTISLVDPPDWQPFDKTAAQLPNFNWVVFTSTNAVIQTKQRLSKLSIALNRYADLKIAAVGNQTAEAIKSAGWQLNLLPQTFQAEGLLKKFMDVGISGQSIWLPRALKAREFLVKELQKAGAEITITPVYQNTIPYQNKGVLRDTLERENTDWITFTSSSTVTNFFKVLGKTPSQNHLPKLASIGIVTTQTLNDLQLNPQFTAIPQNLDGLIQGILDWEINQNS